MRPQTKKVPVAPPEGKALALSSNTPQSSSCTPPAHGPVMISGRSSMTAVDLVAGVSSIRREMNVNVCFRNRLVCNFIRSAREPRSPEDQMPGLRGKASWSGLATGVSGMVIGCTIPGTHQSANQPQVGMQPYHQGWDQVLELQPHQPHQGWQ